MTKYAKAMSMCGQVKKSKCPNVASEFSLKIILQLLRYGGIVSLFNKAKDTKTIKPELSDQLIVMNYLTYK